MYINEITINVKARFKIYQYIICDDKRQIWQLSHFKNKRTYDLKIIKYNEKRNGYRINSNWVQRNRLINLMIKCEEKLIIQERKEFPF